MSAQDNISPLQFYHGTKHDFKPGDMVESGHPMRHQRGSGQDGDFVYAAAHPGTAGNFGSKVFQVEPTGGIEHDPEDAWDQGLFRSTKPMRVVKRVQGS